MAEPVTIAVLPGDGIGPEVVDEAMAVLDDLYDPGRAHDWDAVGLVLGDPDQPVSKVLLAVDPVRAVADEAVAWDADLVLVHHPLWLRGVTSFAATTPKGQVAHALSRANVALMTCHTNADSPALGVSEAMALALGLTDLRPLEVDPDDPASGSGRIGTLTTPTTVGAFAQTVTDALPSHRSATRVAGDLDRPVTTVALCGGSGDFLLETATAAGADVYVTSDLRHHPVSEHLESGGCPVIDVPHWAAEWTWLPVAAAALGDRLDGIETRVSTLVTDPWSSHLPGTVSP